jgi:hypothetical protein
MRQHRTKLKCFQAAFLPTAPLSFSAAAINGFLRRCFDPDPLPESGILFLNAYSDFGLGQFVAQLAVFFFMVILLSAYANFSRGRCLTYIGTEGGVYNEAISYNITADFVVH